MHRQRNTPHPQPPGQPARERPLAAMPLAERRRRPAGIPAAVLEGGDGQPVVFLHGAAEFAAVWLRVVPELVSSPGSSPPTCPDMVEAASTRYGWPLHAIDNCRDDPAFEQPEAFLDALRTTLASKTPQERGGQPWR